MECRICKGTNFTAGSKWELKNGFYKRNRKCKKCGHLLITLELPEEDFNKHIKLVRGLKKIIKEFMKK